MQLAQNQRYNRENLRIFKQYFHCPALESSPSTNRGQHLLNFDFEYLYIYYTSTYTRPVRVCTSKHSSNTASNNRSSPNLCEYRKSPANKPYIPPRNQLLALAQPIDRLVFQYPFPISCLSRAPLILQNGCDITIGAGQLCPAVSSSRDAGRTNNSEWAECDHDHSRQIPRTLFETIEQRYWLLPWGLQLESALFGRIWR